MSDTTANGPAGQPVCHVNEWLNSLKDAAANGLTDPARAAQIEVQYAIGLLTPDRLKAAVADALRAGPAAGKALDAITPNFAPGDVTELRAVPPEGGGGLSYCGRLDVSEQRSAMEAFISENQGTRNIYVGCNPRRPDMAGTTQAASAADVPVRRNIVLDLDLKDAPSTDPDWTRTVEALRSELDPTLVLNSGNGFHVWLPIEPLSGPDVAASTVPISAAMTRLGADNIADPPRIVRLPFTLNLPNAKKRERGAIVRLALPC